MGSGGAGCLFSGEPLNGNVKEGRPSLCPRLHPQDTGRNRRTHSGDGLTPCGRTDHQVASLSEPQGQLRFPQRRAGGPPVQGGGGPQLPVLGREGGVPLPLSCTPPPPLKSGMMERVKSRQRLIISLIITNIIYNYSKTSLLWIK